MKEKRDNRPRFSISFILQSSVAVRRNVRRVPRDVRGHADIAETLADSVWLLVVLFALLNGFFFLTSTRATATKISMSWISRLL